MHKKILKLLATALMWGGCSKDDDESTFDTANLIGKWECYKDYDEELDEWDYDWCGY